MEGKKAIFVKGIVGTDEIMDRDIPHVAFVGRSNVGKSSVINSVLGKRNLVKSSGTPGKTKEINFFLVDGKHFLVDLPGYGFARMGAKNAEKLRKMILWYLTNGQKRLKKVVMVVDATVDPMPYDEEMAGILRNERIPFIVTANKIDRLNQSARVHAVRALESAFAAPIILYSARTNEGRDALAVNIFH